MDFETICDELKRLGVQEVFLTMTEGHTMVVDIPCIEFRGFGGDVGEHFVIRATNEDFEKNGL